MLPATETDAGGSRIPLTSLPEGFCLEPAAPGRGSRSTDLFGTTQTNTVNAGTDQTLEISSGFSKSSGRAHPSGPGAIAFC